MGQKKILIVESSDEFGRLLAYNLNLAGFQVATLRASETAQKTFQRRPCDLVVIGPSFSEPRGVEILKSIRKVAHVPAILLSFTRGSSTDKKGTRPKYVLLPFSLKALLERANGLLGKRSGRRRESLFV